MSETVNIHETNGRSVTEALPDIHSTRRRLIAMRVQYGANMPIGRRCSNIVEMLENYQEEREPAVRSNLLRLIQRQMADLAALTQ